MDDDDLLQAIESNGPLRSTTEAREVLGATAETLGERITDGQAADLADTLPPVAANPLRSAHPGEAEAFSVPVFLDRVASRIDADADPLPAVRSVLAAIGEAGSAVELERTRDQLSAEFDLLFDPGEPMDGDEFRGIVAGPLPDGVDASDAIEATLRTLGERISGGQAGDLATYLPRDVRAPLSGVDEAADEFGRGVFEDRVADRADVDEADAPDVVRTVITAITETTAEREFENVRTQLPAEFDPLFEPP